MADLCKNCGEYPVAKSDGEYCPACIYRDRINKVKRPYNLKHNSNLKKLGSKKTHSKYNAVKKEYNGRVYDSTLEANTAMWLDSLLKSKKLIEIIPQYMINFVINDILVAYHIVDFLVTLSDGRQKYVEVKGMIAKGFVIKKKLTQALYPKTEYLINPTEKELFR